MKVSFVPGGVEWGLRWDGMGKDNWIDTNGIDYSSYE